jgi:hypothetical protein
MTGHGGHRKGAGRPAGTLRPNRTELVAVRLATAEREKAARLGSGNASRGIRYALNQCAAITEAEERDRMRAADTATRAALLDLIALGLSDEDAQAVVTAIAQGDIRRVSIAY